MLPLWRQSGFIDLDELLHFGASVGAGWSRAACEALLNKIDTDGDAQISLSEFESFMSEVGLHGCGEEVAAFIEASEMRRKLADPYDEAQVPSSPPVLHPRACTCHPTPVLSATVTGIWYRKGPASVPSHRLGRLGLY